MSIDGLPPLRDVIARHGLSANKALGQNFLLDLNLTCKIARASGPLDGATVIEIGAGPGGLTRALLLEGAKHVIAIERDSRALPALAEIASHYPGQLTVIEGDALALDLADISAGHERVRIVANLPYNIGTELLTGWLTPKRWPPFYQSMTLMFQREVAERIVATPGSNHFGRLAVLAGWRARSHIAFDVPPQAFSPPPKVTSSVVHIEPNASPLECSAERLARVTQAGFGQRRKMLRQSLKPIGGEALLERAGIQPTLRAENLTVAQFVTLANLI
jgi:16S rRNA (adenine1518-N6/adenine1519-N6)-dimethyltransferase